MNARTAPEPPSERHPRLRGLGDELLYEKGLIATNLPLAELKRRSYINARAQAADEAMDFSRRIRQDVSGTKP